VPDQLMATTLKSLQHEGPELVLPVVLFGRYLYFLARRPISESNLHYRATRVAGLQTLIPLFANEAHPPLAKVAEMLRTLTPANLVRLAPAIQRVVRIYRDPLLPRTFVSTEESTDAEFFAEVQRVLVLIGPAIGIGDEIITFSLPRALRAILAVTPGVQITVASSYPQVWDRVDGVDAARPYGDMQGLLKCVRSDSFDLLMVVDFETPGLTNAMCFEPTVSRYIELSLGPRQMLVLDKVRQRQWRMPVAEPNFDNFYDCMRHMMHWLGAPEDLSTEALIRSEERGKATNPDELIFFINAFTSKEDPSERYWSELLASMLPPELEQPVRLVINTGPNLATRSLAFAMARRVEALGRKGVRCEVPYHADKPGTTLTIGDIFLFSNRADVVVTADSFPAHAAQLYRKLTVVLGRENTENWRSPSPRSFYFCSTQSLDEVSFGIRCLLRDALDRSMDVDAVPAHGCGARPRLHCVLQLASAAARLRELLASKLSPGDESEDAAWVAAWERCRNAQAALLESLAEASPGYLVLFDDNVYHELLPRLPSSNSAHDVAIWQHRRRRLREWENSNLVKYVQLCSRTPEADDTAREVLREALL
jgi:ADP-heptose:LPS heptosyltransferase